jgi:hypothetical protein
MLSRLVTRLLPFAFGPLILACMAAVLAAFAAADWGWLLVAAALFAILLNGS